jgi:hypothetical protein
MKDSRSLIEKAIELFKLWLQARYVKSAGARFFTGGLALLLAFLSTSVMDYVQIDLSIASFSFRSPEIPLYVEVIIFGLAVIFTISGALMLLRDDQTRIATESAERGRQIHLVVELDALNDGVRPALLDAVPPDTAGQRIPITLNLRDAMLGAHRLDSVASRIIGIKQQISSHKAGRAPGEYHLHVGGLGPVPLQFALGNVVDNEGSVNWADWNPMASKWAWPDSGAPVSLWPLPAIKEYPREVVLKAGITYEILDDDVKKAFPNVEILKWEPDSKLFRVVIDEAGLRAISREFEKLLNELQGRGVKKIHFLLACSSAFCMALGSAYDSRNMPELIVYQYERNSEKLYTWGFLLKAHQGEKTIDVVDRR